MGKGKGRPGLAVSLLWSASLHVCLPYSPIWGASTAFSAPGLGMASVLTGRTPFGVAAGYMHTYMHVCSPCMLRVSLGVHSCVQV